MGFDYTCPKIPASKSKQQIPGFFSVSVSESQSFPSHLEFVFGSFFSDLFSIGVCISYITMDHETDSSSERLVSTLFQKRHMNNEQNPCCLWYIGGGILPS